MLVVVTGVAGSGKSSLIHGSVAGRDERRLDRPGAIRGSRRSNPATYTGLLEPIRKAFAKANGVKPGAVQRQLRGRVPELQRRRRHLHRPRDDGQTVATTCEECEGKRFDASVLEYKLGGKDISEVLAMSVDRGRGVLRRREARRRAAHKILERLADVGLGYLTSASR